MVGYNLRNSYIGHAELHAALKKKHSTVVEKLLSKARIKGQETKQGETGKSSLDLRSSGRGRRGAAALLLFGLCKFGETLSALQETNGVECLE